MLGASHDLRVWHLQAQGGPPCRAIYQHLSLSLFSRRIALKKHACAWHASGRRNFWLWCSEALNWPSLAFSRVSEPHC